MKVHIPFSVRWNRHILRMCEQYRPRYCLDVGCGHGYISKYLQMRGIISIGLDVDIKTLQATIRSLFVNADAQQLPFKSGVFDVVLALEVLEHLLAPREALVEFHRVLNSNGILILTTPTPNAPNSPGHISVESRSHWISELRLLGFNVEIIRYMYEVEETNLPRSVKSSPKSLKRLIQYIFCLYKRYLSVTSTKLLCVKESQ